jgi:hypothetical protein
MTLPFSGREGSKFKNKTCLYQFLLNWTVFFVIAVYYLDIKLHTLFSGPEKLSIAQFW